MPLPTYRAYTGTTPLRSLTWSAHRSGSTGPQQTDRRKRHRVMPPTPSLARVIIKMGNEWSRFKVVNLGCESWAGASQLVTRSPRHSPESYDELTGGWNTVLWRVDRRLKRRAGAAVTSWPHVAVCVDSSALFNSPNTYDIPPLSMVLEILCDGDSDSSWCGRPT